MVSSDNNGALILVLFVTSSSNKWYFLNSPYRLITYEKHGQNHQISNALTPSHERKST
ncbi:MAG: hypothetical protein ACI9YP_001202 [Colwellia sp.]|jgi:hypothetical protein